MKRIQVNTFHPPVKSPIVTSPYGWRKLNGKPQFHDGVDYVSPESNEVFALWDGVIAHDMDYYEASKRWTDGRHSLGNFVIVKHVIDGKLYFVRYCHLSRNYVNAGQEVKRGQVLGRYADVGFSYGAHLHLDGYDYQWHKTWGPLGNGNFSKVLKQYGVKTER